MNTFWLKVAGGAVAVVVVIVIVNAIMPSGDKKPKPPDKTFYDVVDEDKNKYLNDPTLPKPDKHATNNSEQQPDASNTNRTKTQPPAAPTRVTLYFSKLSEIDDIEAERLLNVAVPGYSIGRLPVTGYRLAVDTCRQIIQRWPDSWYAYRAKQMLTDMPVRYRKIYHVTEEELDLSMFARQRPGTEPFEVDESK